MANAEWKVPDQVDTVLAIALQDTMPIDAPGRRGTVRRIVSDQPISEDDNVKRGYPA